VQHGQLAVILFNCRLVEREIGHDHAITRWRWSKSRSLSLSVCWFDALAMVDLSRGGA
jgi:hypothetical protein